MLDFKKGNDKPKNDRIKFEESESKKCMVENEFCKIYLDSISHQTFKVIGGYVVPIELREFNMWKNRQKNPRDFCVETIKDDSGEVENYIISKSTGAAPKQTNENTQASAPAQHNATTVNVTGNQNAVAVSPAASVTSTVSVTQTTSEQKKNDAAPRKRKPKSTRLSKCAICKNEFKDEDLLLFVNRNYCFACVEEAVKEKVQGFPVDPVEKAILDITTADELYCTYSTITGYPYIDDNGCVNVCSVSRAAESVIESTSVETIEDKGVFFDDLKRYGMKKIIVNNDESHIFTPEDFDEHVKTEGVSAPKLYFNVIKDLQLGNTEIGTNVASVFLGSTVYTLASNNDITEITEDNFDCFKPLTVSDGNKSYCPVFTDITEARSVGLSFKGLYSIKAALLTDKCIDSYMINPSSIDYFIEKTYLEGVEPYEETEDDTVTSDDNSNDTAAQPEKLVSNAVAVEDITVIENTDTSNAVIYETPANIETSAFFENKVDVEETDNTNTYANEEAAGTEIPAVEPSAPESNTTYETNDNVKEYNITGATTEDTVEQAVADTISETNIDALVQEIAAENEPIATLELSGLAYETNTDEEQKPQKSVQEKIAETNILYNEIQNAPDYANAAAIRRQLNDSRKELSEMIVALPTMYAQFDSSTKHIFIDGHNRGHIFSDKEIAEKSIAISHQNGIELFVKEFSKDSVLTMIYEFKRHGIQDLVVDDAANWIIMSTDEISDSIDVDDTDLIKIPITNPELMFSMTTLFQKLQIKNDYPSRRADISALERRMIREFISSRYILPLISSNGEEHPVTLENKNGIVRVLVFSDVYEMKRFFGDKFDIIKDYKILSYNDMINTYASKPNTVVVLNEGSLRFEFNPMNCDQINKVTNS